MYADYASQADTSNHGEISSTGDQSLVTMVSLNLNVYMYSTFFFSIQGVANGRGC